VLHQDIKPGNLFLCESGQVKITGFGLARAASGTTLAAGGVLVGTFAYLAPERWRGEPPTFSNDIWAVGCVLYRLISGRLPRVLPGAADYAAAADRGDPIPDLAGISAAPAWLTGLVMAMLTVDPDRRPTAGECVQLLSGEQLPVPVTGRPVPRPRPGQPGPATLIAAASEPATRWPAQPAAARMTRGRSRRRDRVILAVGGALLLLIAGSVTAWRLTSFPRATELAVHSSASAPSSASGTAPGSTPARSASAAASRPGSATASAPSSPAVTTAVPLAASHSASPASSRPRPPAASAPPVPSGSAPAASPPPPAPPGSPPPSPVGSPPAPPAGAPPPPPAGAPPPPPGPPTGGPAPSGPGPSKPPM
jgi:serine/threonine protein kinase